jgi:hypothetical protein
MVIKFEFVDSMTSIENGKFMTLKVRASERRNSREDEFVSGFHLCVLFQSCGCRYRSSLQRDGIPVGGDPADPNWVDSFRGTHRKMYLQVVVRRRHILRHPSERLMWIYSNESEIALNSRKPSTKSAFQGFLLVRYFQELEFTNSSI